MKRVCYFEISWANVSLRSWRSARLIAARHDPLSWLSRPVGVVLPNDAQHRFRLAPEGTEQKLQRPRACPGIRVNWGARLITQGDKCQRRRARNTCLQYLKPTTTRLNHRTIRRRNLCYLAYQLEQAERLPTLLNAVLHFPFWRGNAITKKRCEKIKRPCFLKFVFISYLLFSWNDQKFSSLDRDRFKFLYDVYDLKILSLSETASSSATLLRYYGQITNKNKD